MKYIKLLLIAVLASAITTSCYDNLDWGYNEKPFKGAGDAEVQFDVFEDTGSCTREVIEKYSNGPYTELIQTSVSFVGEPSTFPFSVDVNAEVVSGDVDTDIDDLIYFTSNPLTTLYFAYPGEESKNQEGKMVGTAMIECKLANDISISQNTTIKLTISNPTNGVTLGNNTKFEITILNMPD